MFHHVCHVRMLTLSAIRAKNFYEILGVENDASKENLTKAYKHLVKKTHPDLFPGDESKESEFKVGLINTLENSLVYRGIWPNNFGIKLKFLSKIEIFVKNRNFDQKSKFSSKIEIFAKNRNFDQKSKFWPKIKIFVKNRNCRQKPRNATSISAHQFKIMS